MLTTVASLHMDENAESWLQVYKLKVGLGSWQEFMVAVQEKFGAYDYQHAIDELLDLQQTGSVVEYAGEFEALQYQITMHDLGMGDVYFISQFIKGLKPELRYQVQGQVPAIMERAVRLAEIQETIQEKTKSKFQRTGSQTRNLLFLLGRMTKDLSQHWWEYLKRQPRDFCRAKNLCYFCREPYDPAHAAKCPKRPKAQANALVVNDLDVHLTDEVLK